MLNNIEYACCLHKQHSHNYRNDIFYHNNIHSFSAEFFAVSLHFVDNPLWFYNPADENAGENCNNRHKEAVADIVHQIQELADASVGERQFQIKKAVPERNDD